MGTLLRTTDMDNRFVATQRAIRLFRINARLELARIRGEETRGIIAEREAVLDEADAREFSDDDVDVLIRAAA